MPTPKQQQYLVDDYFLEMMTNLNEKEIATYKRLHKVNVEKQQALLRAVYDLLKPMHDSVWVKNVFEEKVKYLGSEGDGFSLVNDIADLLKLERLDG